MHLGSVEPVPSYDDGLQRFDAGFGRMLRELRRLGLDRRTTVVIAATSGRDLGGHPDAAPGALCATWTHVPLLIRFPGGAGAGTEPRTVEAIDLMPTLLEITGVEIPVCVQGASLAPMIRGESTPPYIAFGESESGDAGRRYVALGDYRLHAVPGRDEYELYRLSDDPLETSDRSRYEDEADRIAVLRDHLEAWRRMVRAASLDPDRRTGALEDRDLERLRSLGYLR
jgi:arylsulfatase A-like enzyme